MICEKCKERCSRIGTLKAFRDETLCHSPDSCYGSMVKRIYNNEIGLLEMELDECVCDTTNKFNGLIDVFKGIEIKTLRIVLDLLDEIRGNEVDRIRNDVRVYLDYLEQR